MLETKADMSDSVLESAFLELVRQAVRAEAQDGCQIYIGSSAAEGT